MAIVVLLWVILTLLFAFWTAARASSKGYSYGVYLVLGFLFGPLAWMLTYSLPTKLQGETLGQASGRALTTGALNVTEAARDAGRARSPGVARGVGAAATRAAMNAAGGAKDAVAERRGNAGGQIEATPPTAGVARGLAANLANRATRTALNAADGARRAAAEHRAASTQAQPSESSEGGESLESRLATLATLRERALLTEEEYRDRRESILAEL